MFIKNLYDLTSSLSLSSDCFHAIFILIEFIGFIDGLKELNKVEIPTKCDEITYCDNIAFAIDVLKCWTFDTGIAYLAIKLKHSLQVADVQLFNIRQF